MRELFANLREIVKERSLRLTWALIILVSLLLFFFYIFFFKPSLINISNRITTYQVSIAQNSRYRVEDFLSQNIRSLDDLTHNLGIIESKFEKKAIIERFLKERSWIGEINLIDAYGFETLKVSQIHVVASDDYSDASQSESYRTAIRGEAYIGPVYASDKFIPSLVVALPIQYAPDKIAGVVEAKLSLQEVWNILDGINAGYSGQVYLVDAGGLLISHGDIQKVLKYNLLGRKAVEKVIIQRKPVVGLDAEDIYVNENNQRVYVVGLPLDLVKWGVFVEAPINNRIKYSGIILGVVTAWLLVVLFINAVILARVFLDLKKGREQLKQEVEKRTKELKELDRVAKLLVKRDLELTSANSELDKKIKELEESKSSLIKALKDVQDARKKSDEEKNKTLAIVSNFTDPIIVLDKFNRINLVNPSAERIFGLSPECIGMPVAGGENFSLENFKSVIKAEFSIEKKAKNESDGALVEEVRIKHGEQDLTYKVLTVRIYGEEREYYGFMKIFYDLTREKMIDRMKSEFISIAAHQLRTPLSAIKWIIKMVLDEDAGKLNDEQKDLLSKGYQSNERIITLVNDLLDVSRIEEGRFGYNFTNSDFQEVLDLAMDSCEKLISKNHLKFILKKQADLPKIYMDKERVSLVLQNLLENSIKYTPEYGTIELGAEIAKNNFLRIWVKDNGVGIPDSDKAKLFSKFFRASNVMRMETEGTGLGLFIAKNIVERHGGTISIASEEGRGTQASFTLPLNK